MNAAIRMDVFLEDGYRGDWRAAIDEAYAACLRLNTPIKLVYANQKSFLLKPDMSVDDVEKLKGESFRISV